eukprot:1077221-Rhodomonas_salina.2
MSALGLLICAGLHLLICLAVSRSQIVSDFSAVVDRSRPARLLQVQLYRLSSYACAMGCLAVM